MKTEGGKFSTGQALVSDSLGTQSGLIKGSSAKIERMRHYAQTSCLIFLVLFAGIFKPIYRLVRSRSPLFPFDYNQLGYRREKQTSHRSAFVSSYQGQLQITDRDRIHPAPDFRDHHIFVDTTVALDEPSVTDKPRELR